MDIEIPADTARTEPSVSEVPEGTTRSVGVGSIVKLGKQSDGGLIRIQIVEKNHDPASGFVGVHTPLGAALLDARVGEDVEYQSGPYLRESR